MTKIETLTEMARDAWLDMSVADAIKYARDHDFVDDDVNIDLTAAEEHFVDAWVEREWDNDFHADRDERV